MENHFTRNSKLTLCVLVFILSLSLTLTTVYGQAFQSQGSLKERLAERGIDLNQLRERVREVMQVQNRYKDILMEKSGVVGTGTGITPEGEPVIKVFTARAGIAGIPESLEGVRVRTKVTGRFYAVQDPPPEPSRTDRWPRPVPIGVSTGHPDITAGTIGARVTDGANVYALSNNHVYANLNQATIGDSVIQPGTYDGGSLPDDLIGTLANYVDIEFCSSWFGFLLNCPDNQIDAAIALSSTAELGSATPTDGYGSPQSTTVPPEVGQNVMKYGRTTGFTHGSIDAINTTVNVGYPDGLTARYVNQIIVASNTAFILGGDSGSLLVTDPSRNPVGLLYAGNQSGTSAIANRIDLVLNHFDVTIDSGAPPVLETISLTPASATIGIGETKQFIATGHYSDSSTKNLTDAVAWVSSDTDVARFDSPGLARGLSAGITNITATQDEITSSPIVTLTITKTPPVLESITVTPTSATIGIGETKQFIATGHYSDDNTSDLTSTALWVSSNTDVARFDSPGLATGLSAGTTNITATQDEIASNQATLEVTVPDSIYMHVGDLDGESNGRRFWRAKIYITVHNSDEQPVADAVVVGSFDDCPGGVDCAKFQCTTGSNGRCNVVGYQYWADHLTFTVESVTHSTLEYNPDLNHDPDVDSNPPGTSIYVPRP